MASALVMAAAALLSAWAGGWAFALFWFAAAAVVASEWLAMTRASPRLPLLATAVTAIAAVVVAYRLGSSVTVVAALVGGAALVTLGIARDGRSRLWAAAGLAYAAVVALVPVAIRDAPDLGLVAILWMFAVVWSTDVVAYFVGRRLGGPKLWPSVSPKKTWSGFAGGLAGATVAGVAVAAAGRSAGVELPAGLPLVALASVVASVASQGGDLAESAMKRAFAVKDSGRLIPGHGGAMDRLDGFAAVALLSGLALAGARLVGR